MPVYNYTTFDDPAANTGTTQPFGVNDTDQIVGGYQNGSGLHGFLLSGGQYTTLDDLLATNGTAARGINDAGQIVGSYRTSSTATGTHGFLLTGGQYITLDDPMANGVS